jgi:hypothetical protein
VGAIYRERKVGKTEGAYVIRKEGRQVRRKVEGVV